MKTGQFQPKSLEPGIIKEGGHQSSLNLTAVAA